MALVTNGTSDRPRDMITPENVGLAHVLKRKYPQYPTSQVYYPILETDNYLEAVALQSTDPDNLLITVRDSRGYRQVMPEAV